MESARRLLSPKWLVFELKMGTALIFVLLLSCSLSSSQAQLVDSDLVFDENNAKDVKIEEQQSHLSSQINFNQDAGASVEKLDEVPEDTLFDQLHHHMHQLKKRAAGFFDWLSVTSADTSSPPTTEARGRRDTDQTLSKLTAELANQKSTTAFQPAESSKTISKRNDDVTLAMGNSTESDEEEGDDSSDGDGDGDDGSTSSSSIPHFGDSSIIPVTDSSSETYHFRVTIKLLIPYTSEIADPSGAVFKEYGKSITDTIKQVLGAPNFTKARLAAIINSAMATTSNAIVDLEIAGKETAEMIKNELTHHLETEKKLGYVAATADDLKVNDFDDTTLIPCDPNLIPCLESPSICYSLSQRCDGIKVCPEASDENDCPSKGNKTTCDRGDDSYTCMGGEVMICSNERCDYKRDCPLGDDEENCTRPCGDNEFTCGNSCILLSKRCDGVVDCTDPNDEDVSICPPTPSPTPPTTPTPPVCSTEEFPCDNKCLPNSKRCNGKPDCSDLSDELNCTITPPPTLPPTTPCNYPQYYQCKSGNCIDIALRCDTLVQCNDGSDEENCTKRGDCTDTEFKCYDGTCYLQSKRCDGYYDCVSGEDEAGCPSTVPPTYTPIPTPPRTPSSTPPECRADEFRCRNGLCVRDSYRCDGSPDCADRSDEEECPPTPRPCSSPAEFLCGDGRCINKTQVCNRVVDCSDYSDEAACQFCRQDQFQCDSNRCIPLGSKCDQRRDCLDGTDELGCVPRSKCLSSEFECNDHHCIPMFRHCDGELDCRDGSDELICPTGAPPWSTTTPGTTTRTPSEFCGRGKFMCWRRFQCIDERYRCDGRIDCYDRTDEESCNPEGVLRLKAVPNEQVIKQGQEVVFQCRDEGPLRARVTWIRGNGLPLPPGSRNLDLGRLEIPNIQLNHAGVYICQAVEPHSRLRGAQIQVSLVVEPFVAPTPVAPIRCRPDQATCHNGECIPKQLICNGQNDCSDGSDEVRCKDGCEPNEFRCNNRQCIYKAYRCDSEDDCLDGSDELNCEPSPPGSPCRYDEFPCRNSSQCIPKSLQCDHESDCDDGTDEIGCSKPIVTVPPPPGAQLPIGDVFSITCQAIGIPTPEIVWRLNWGHVPAKCRMSSNNGIGTLTCPNIQREDQGAYSCEAVNSRGSTFAPIDTILVVTTPSSPLLCSSGQFNDLANSSSECIDCFCFGVTRDCKSANLFIYQLPPPTNLFRIVNVHFDRRRFETEIRSNEIITNFSVDQLSSDSFKVRTTVTETLNSENVYPYLELPSYSGNQLKSYGGYIRYLVRYEDDGPPLHNPNIILSGNGYKLAFGGKPFVPGFDKSVNARLFFGSWFHANESSDIDPSKGRVATREEIMMTLQNLDHVLVKLQYTAVRNIDVTIKDFRFDSASSVAGGEQAAYVEECRCPPGYSGLSCENCAPGYTRSPQQGPWLGRCVESSRPPSRCPLGTYGDPSRGYPCASCPCPLTSSSNQFAPSCFLDTDGRPTCNCPTGYEGRNCERCSNGFTGNPVIPGSSCRRTPCDPVGSTRPVLDPYTNTCPCKQNVIGAYCNQCKPYSFYLAPSNQYGCISCFCMGVTQECTSSNWFRQQIVAGFGRDTQEFAIARRKEITDRPISTFTINPYERGISYSAFGAYDTEVFYWILPQRFLNDKITSYGGYLNYTLRYTPAPGGQSSRNNAPDVEIISDNNVRLLYFKHGDPLQPDIFQTVSVPLLEQYWQREDGQLMNREHFLMALAEVNAILIKATYTTSTQEVGLQSVILETAENRNTGSRRAYEVEQCRCPPGYRGLSCQECDAGYYRVSEGLYLGVCERCNCNGHTNECDPETGYCLNCGGHTTGQNCEQCESGFTGNPATGACIPSDDSGRDPCPCDARGSLEPLCTRGPCNCKANVEGPYCTTCKSGFFDLRASRDTGCIDCYCSGVSRQCQSSNLFFTQVPMPIIDDNHGFTLTDSNRNRYITRGFRVNPALSQIEYDYTTERGQKLYWSLPSQFTGNRLTSYGGNLTWTQGFNAPRDAFPLYENDLVIIGDGISVFWTNNYPISANAAVVISVKLEEKDFRRIAVSGKENATRADFMRVLSNIEAILIRASYASQTTYVYIGDVSLDTAVAERISSIRATQVEVCSCPTGYVGHSCETCDTGYYHVMSSNGIKECRRCPCNNNEESCIADASSRVICRCKDGFSGEFCQEYGVTQTTPVTPTPGQIPQPTIDITIRDPITIVAVGGTAQYRCQARSRVAQRVVSINWSKKDGTLPLGRAIDDGTGHLVLIGAAPSDSGTYVCTAYDGFTTARQEINITVGEIPTPKVTLSPSPPSGSLVVFAGSSLTIECEAPGTPPPRLELGRVGTSVIKFDQGRVTLTISSVNKSDEGSYYCRATNEYGRFDLQRLDIRVSDYPVISPIVAQVSIDPPDFRGAPGDVVQFQCSVNPQSGYRVSWTRQGNEALPPNASARDGILIIYNVAPRDSGVYICNAISEASGVVESKSETTVTVYGVPEPIPDAEGKPPILSIDPEKQTVPQGNLALIRCITNDPSSRIVWRKVNDNFTSGVQIIGGEIRIPSVQVKDRGIYVCTATNAYGLTQVTSRLEVDRREVPVIEIYPLARSTVREGGETLIQCKVNRGIPQPRVRWSRPGNLTLGPHVEEINGVLRFIDVHAEDEGQYVCIAENVAGAVEAFAYLEVISSPTVTINPPDPSVTFQAGDRIRLECVASGRPIPNVQWVTSNLPGSYQPNVDVQSTPQVAYFETFRAQVSDSGTYTCVASNRAGQAEKSIQVTVIPSYSPPPVRPLNDTVGTNTAPDEEIAFPVGSSASLRCEVDTHREEAVYRYWLRDDRLPLAERHEQKEGVLIIYNIQSTDAGRYSCIIVSNSGQTQRAKTVTLRVIVPPQITLNPTRQVVYPGDNAFISCSAQGDQPITIYWSAVNGPLPRSVAIDRGELQFRGITIHDAGKYVCRAQNLGGTAEAVAEVIVNEVTRPSKPIITAEDHNQLAFEGNDLDLKCTVNALSPDYTIKWVRERSELPRNSQILGNTLRLQMLKAEDSDRYICQVNSPYGVSSDYIDLTVERTCLVDEFRCNDGTCILNSKYCDSRQDCADNSDEQNCHYYRRGANNNITLGFETSRQDIHIGESLNISCLVAGISKKVVWSKVGGHLENNVQIDDNVLRITDAQITNRGVYRCTLNSGERYIDYQLNIQDAPEKTIVAPVNLKLDAYGKNVDLTCNIDLNPPVNYSWVVHSYEKSLRRIVPDTQVLRISRATVNDSGLYFCHAENSQTSISIPTMLVVTEVIPAFKETSYLTLPPLTHATNSFNIEITFKPKSYEGLILFSGQSKDVKGDFLSFGLRSGLPELRFNLGGGPAIIRANEPVKLNKWHTIRLIRNFKEGIMEVNGRYNYTGVSPGKYETLDLQLPLFVGGVTNYRAINETTNLNIGFTGCINRLIIDSKSFDLKREAVQSYGLDNCHNCQFSPCENNGACQETNTPTGYTCICPPGFSGELCSLKKSTCYLDTCGEGQCIENDDGIECHCPFGKTGENCRKNMNINVPAFSKNSYLAYTTPLLKKKLHLFMKLKPVGESYVEHGIILYIAENENESGDFISISVINSYVELKGQIMSKRVYLRSNHYLVPNEYVNLFLNIDSTQVRFSVGNETVLADVFNPADNISDLRLHTPLYVGGYDKKAVVLPAEMVVRNGFHGCISKIEISDIDIRMLQTFVGASNVNDCVDLFGDICEQEKPCQNAGICSTTRDTYKCECSSAFSGQNCERQKDLCEILSPCKNNGKCVGTSGQYKCFCGLGFTGPQCELETSLEYSVNFNGDGYVELSSSLLPHDTMDEVIDIKFSTNASHGLLFWQGQGENVDGSDADFIAITVEYGYVQLSYRTASSGRKVLKATDHKVNDGLSHSVSVRRTESQITVELDAKTSDLSQINERLNTQGNIYIGGLPNFRLMTGNQYASGFVGCVQLLKIHNQQPIYFGQRAISASNAAQCPYRTETNEV